MFGVPRPKTKDPASPFSDIAFPICHIINQALLSALVEVKFPLTIPLLLTVKAGMAKGTDSSVKAKAAKKKKITQTTTSNTKSSGGVYVCPTTNQSVYIGKATLQDLKAKSTYGTTTKKRLWTIPSASVRNDLLIESAKAIAQVEQSLLPSLGGRSWEVTCQLSDAGPSILFRTWKGRMELAALPHMMEKIPQPPVWPGRTKLTPDEYQEGDEDDPLKLQQREISTLSQVAWNLRETKKYPIPTVTLKWQSPDRKSFHSRKSAWEYATAMAAREVEINKILLGIGASGKLLQPFVPTEKTVLQVGKLRFERDGLWVIGQELEWQEDRPELMEEAEAEEEERRLNMTPTNGFELFLAKKRQLYIETHEECETVKQAEAELKKVWKQLSKEEQNTYREPFKPPKTEVSTTIPKPKRPRKSKEPEPEPIKPSMTPREFFVESRRSEFVEERRLARPGWGDLKPSEVTSHLGQEWKDLSPSIRKEWVDKLIAIETEKMEVERKIQEAIRAAIIEKAEIERKECEAIEALEREKLERERIEDKAKEVAKVTSTIEAEGRDCRIQEVADGDSKLIVNKVDQAFAKFDDGFPTESHEEEKKEDDHKAYPSEVLSSTDVAASSSSVHSDREEPESPNKRLVEMLKRKRIASVRQSKRVQFPTRKMKSRWCMNQSQIDKCFVACMDHYDTVMRTVKARDLHRELQDGFDVFRERGFGRYDMELPVFDDPEEFGFLTDMHKSPWIPVVKAILGEDAVLIHKGCFLSMSGSAPQEYHQDGVHLTTQTQKPCHAINVFIPLVDLISRNGPTEFCLGSHILGLEGYDRDYVYTPAPKAGNPVIFDYRLGHRGLGNSSTGVRPIVYVTYARAVEGKEFRDSVNFSRKRYHKIGELKSEAVSREERKNRRKRSREDREAEELERAILESTKDSERESTCCDEAGDVDAKGHTDAEIEEDTAIEGKSHKVRRLVDHVIMSESGAEAVVVGLNEGVDEMTT